jgi:hypothetical protein
MTAEQPRSRPSKTEQPRSRPLSNRGHDRCQLNETHETFPASQVGEVERVHATQHLQRLAEDHLQHRVAVQVVATTLVARRVEFEGNPIAQARSVRASPRRRARRTERSARGFPRQHGWGGRAGPRRSATPTPRRWVLAGRARERPGSPEPTAPRASDRNA